MRLLASTAIAAILLCGPTHAGFFLGLDLKKMCDEGFADQYVAGSYDAYETVAEFGELPFDRVCLPPNTKVSGITKIVCNYIDAEPDALTSSAGVVVAAALLKSYPCR